MHKLQNSWRSVQCCCSKQGCCPPSKSCILRDPGVAWKQLQLWGFSGYLRTNYLSPSVSKLHTFPNILVEHPVIITLFPTILWKVLLGWLVENAIILSLMGSQDTFLIQWAGQSKIGLLHLSRWKVITPFPFLRFLIPKFLLRVYTGQEREMLQG